MSKNAEQFKPEDRLKTVEESPHFDDYDLESYEGVLGVTMEDLAGKVILDIGGAPRGIFAQKAAELGLKVVTLNPRTEKGEQPLTVSALMRALSHAVERADGQEEKEEVDTTTVAGIAQQLPFKDGAFDYEFSAGAVPLYLPRDKEEYKKMFEEVLRTLKPGGKAIFGPIFQQQMDEPELKQVLEKLRLECFITTEEIPPELELFNNTNRCYRLILVKPEILFSK